MSLILYMCYLIINYLFYKACLYAYDSVEYFSSKPVYRALLLAADQLPVLAQEHLLPHQAVAAFLTAQTGGVRRLADAQPDNAAAAAAFGGGRGQVPAALHATRGP